MSPTIAADDMTIVPALVNGDKLYDIRFIQKDSDGGNMIVSSIRVTALQLATFDRKIQDRVKQDFQYPNDLYRDAEAQLKTKQ